jgi:hypothetical protein
MLNGNIVSPPSPQELHQQLLGIPNTPQGNQFLADIIANDKSVKGGIAAAILNLRQKPAPIAPPEGGTVVDGLIQKAQSPFGQAPQQQAPQEAAPQEAAPQEQAPQEGQESMGIAQPGLEEQAQESPMATGGLVAFNHGGGVRRFAEGSSLRDREADQRGRSSGRDIDYSSAMFAPSTVNPEGYDVGAPGWSIPWGDIGRSISGAIPSMQDIKNTYAEFTTPSPEEYEYAKTTDVSPSKKRELEAAKAARTPSLGFSDFSMAPTYPSLQKEMLKKLGVEPFSAGLPSAKQESPANVDKAFNVALEDKKGGDKAAPGYKTTTLSTPEQTQGATVVVTDDQPAAPAPTGTTTATPPKSPTKTASYDEKIKAVMDIYGVPPNIAAELYSEKEHELSKDKSIHLIQDLAAGIGAALTHKAGPTGTGGRYKSDVSGAIGTGLMALVAGRMQSEKAEGAAQDKMDELKVKSKMNEYEAYKDAAKIVLNQETTAAAEQRAWEREQQKIALEGAYKIQAAAARAGLQQPHGLFTQDQIARLYNEATAKAIDYAKDNWNNLTDKQQRAAVEQQFALAVSKAQGLGGATPAPVPTSAPVKLPNGMMYKPPAT